MATSTKKSGIGCSGVALIGIAAFFGVMLAFQAWWEAVAKEWEHGDFWGAVGQFLWILIPVAVIGVVGLIIWAVIRNLPQRVTCPNCGRRTDPNYRLCGSCKRVMVFN